MPGGAQDDAPREAVDAERPGEEQRAEDDAEVVDHGREGGRDEVLSRVQDAHDHPADPEEERRDQHQPGELDRHRLEFGLAAGRLAEARGEQRHEPRRRDEREGRRDDGGDGDEVQDAGGEAPPGDLALPQDDAAERRDERGGKRRAGEQLEDEVREPKGDPVGGEVWFGAERVGDDDGAEEAEEAREDEAERDDAGGAGDGAHAEAEAALALGTCEEAATGGGGFVWCR